MLCTEKGGNNLNRSDYHLPRGNPSKLQFETSSEARSFVAYQESAQMAEIWQDSSIFFFFRAYLLPIR